jgi:hypothetical protein
MKMEGEKFVFRKSALSAAGYKDIQKILNHPTRLTDLWECLEKHNTTVTFGKMPEKRILMDIYEKMLLISRYTETFPLSKKLQGKYRMQLIKLLIIKIIEITLNFHFVKFHFVKNGQKGSLCQT